MSASTYALTNYCLYFWFVHETDNEFCLLAILLLFAVLFSNSAHQTNGRRVKNLSGRCQGTDRIL